MLGSFHPEDVRICRFWINYHISMLLGSYFCTFVQWETQSGRRFCCCLFIYLIFLANRPESQFFSGVILYFTQHLRVLHDFSVWGWEEELLCVGPTEKKEVEIEQKQQQQLWRELMKKVQCIRIKGTQNNLIN